MSERKRREIHLVFHIRPLSPTNASANLYRLVETAKANGIEPHAYLMTVFIELPIATTVEAIEVLLPVPPNDVKNAKVS